MINFVSIPILLDSQNPSEWEMLTWMSRFSRRVASTHDSPFPASVRLCGFTLLTDHRLGSRAYEPQKCPSLPMPHGIPLRPTPHRHRRSILTLWWQPREPQTAKRARMPQQPPQQREIHQSELVLPFKNLLVHRETLKPHQRAPTPEWKIFTTISPPLQSRPHPRNNPRKPSSWCSKASVNYKRYMMPQISTKSRWNEPHSKLSPEHSRKHMSKSKQTLLRLRPQLHQQKLLLTICAYSCCG